MTVWLSERSQMQTVTSLTQHTFHLNLKQYPFKGMGIYKLTGQVVQEFDFPSIEVQYMEKLSIVADPRSK